MEWICERYPNFNVQERWRCGVWGVIYSFWRIVVLQVLGVRLHLKAMKHAYSGVQAVLAQKRLDKSCRRSSLVRVGDFFVGKL